VADGHGPRVEARRGEAVPATPARRPDRPRGSERSAPRQSRQAGRRELAAQRRSLAVHFLPPVGLALDEVETGSEEPR
jgi:hypothetical protein